MYKFRNTKYIYNLLEISEKCLFSKKSIMTYTPVPGTLKLNNTEFSCGLSFGLFIRVFLTKILYVFLIY
jgi:hypothetical protein